VENSRSMVFDLGFEFVQMRAGSACGGPRRSGETDTAGPHQPFAEAVAAHPQRHVEEITAHAAAVVGRRQKGHIAAQRAQVAHVVGDPFQLQCDGADDVSPGIGLAFRSAPQPPGPCTGCGRWRCHRRYPRPKSAAAWASAFSNSVLDPAVLVPQLNLQVQHPLADAVEPEMTGLDNAGVHRPHGHLVDLFAFHGIVS
jgi:hypothetical protein